jgi:hypothetical protein
MKNIEMFFALAMTLFFCFVYFFLSADPNFGLRQTVNLLCVFGLITCAGALAIRRITRKRNNSAVDESKLTSLNLSSDSETEKTADQGNIKTTIAKHD